MPSRDTITYFTRGYLGGALRTTRTGEAGHRLRDIYNYDAFMGPAKEAADKDCANFLQVAAALLTGLEDSNDEISGFDFWYSRNELADGGAFDGDYGFVYRRPRSRATRLTQLAESFGPQYCWVDNRNNLHLTPYPQPATAPAIPPRRRPRESTGFNAPFGTSYASLTAENAYDPPPNFR